MARNEGLTPNTRVKCTGHGGQHRGVISRVLVPGQMYVVTWEGKGVATVQVGMAKLKYPADIVRDHLLDLSSCEASKIEKA